MAVFQWGGEIKCPQNSSRNTQSTHAVLQNVHAEILVLHSELPELQKLLLLYCSMHWDAESPKDQLHYCINPNFWVVEL